MNRPPLALVGTLTVVGFLLVVTGTATSAASRTEEPRRQALIDQILARQQDVDDLDKAVAELRGQVADRRLELGAESQRQEDQNRAQEQLAMAAGTLAVAGPGIVITLEDAPKRTGEDASKFDANRIQDGDIQLVVNALFDAGAEAVSINDNRVVAVTPIRAAGGTIVVNYRPVNSPYRISAIGADKNAFSSSEIARRFDDWEERFDLGYEVDSSKKLTIPGYSGRVGIDIAHTDTPETPS